MAEDGLTSPLATLESDLLGRDNSGKRHGSRGGLSCRIGRRFPIVCFLRSLALTATLTEIVCAERLRAKDALQ